MSDRSTSADTAATIVAQRVRGGLRSLGWLLASRGVIAVLSLVYLAIITRTLGVNGFGRFVLITGSAQALVTLLSFQSWQIIVKYGTAPATQGDDAALGRLYRAAVTLDAASAVIGAVAAALILSIWGEALGIGATLQRATLILTIVQLISVRSTPIGILRLRDKFSLSALAESTQPAARLLGAIAVSFIHPTLQGFLVAWMVAEFLTAIAFWTTVARHGDLAIMRRGRGGLRAAIAEHPRIARFALMTNINTTLGMSSKQIPLLLVGASVGVAAAGAFRLAAQLANALTKLSELLARAAFPEIVRAIDTIGVAGVGRVLRRSILFSSIVGIVIYVIVVLFGEPVLALIGSREFLVAYPILLWLAAAGCVDLITVGFEPLLVAAGRTGTTFLIRLSATLALFVTSLALSAWLGAVGIAIAVLAHSVVVSILLGLVVARLVRRRPDAPAGS